MNEKSSTSTASATSPSKNLVNIALVLAAVTAVLHLYIGIFVYGVPLGIPLILIALVYLGGILLITMNKRRDLWLKIGIYWIMVVLVLWAASAAVNAPNTNIPLAYVSKAVEFILLGVLLRLRTASRP
jgi:predicted neutral ceramidase superfamily lipid hydrolase